MTFILLSFDIKELYPSVNKMEIASIVNVKLEAKFGESQKIDLLINSSNLVIHESHFSFDGNFYKQIKGLPIGSPISAIFAEFKLRYLVAKILNNQSRKIKIWLRNIGDVFVVIKGRENLQKILEEMNELGFNIKFTLELEEGGGESYFVDVKIIWKDGENR